MYCMALGKPNTLPNFECKNITSKTNVSEKVLSAVIGNKLEFTEQLNAVCKETNLKLYGLIESLDFRFRTVYRNNQCSYTISFQLCSLIWMSCYRRNMHKMNRINSQYLRLLLKNSQNYFQDLFRSSIDIPVHRRCVNPLLKEVWKNMHGISPEVMNGVFYTRANILNKRKFNVL